MKKVIEASKAVAEAVRLCKPDVIPVYPITPQTHIVEDLADFVADGSLDAEIIDTESEHSAISAAIGAQATGVRTFTASSSQGLALMHEVLHIASGMRMPIVMCVANRALSAPINIWNDQQDSISQRDTGWIQIYVESSQEALDTIIQAYKIAENKEILIPVMVCIDGFNLSHVFESVDIPTKSKVLNFLPRYKPVHAFLDPRKPMTQGPVAYPEHYMGFKHNQQEAILRAIWIISKVNSEFRNKFRRSYGDGLTESYKTSDADTCIIAMGSICGTLKVAIDEMRKENSKVGLVKIRAFRPFPVESLTKTVKSMKRIIILDKDVSYGYEGALHTEIKAALHNKNCSIEGYIVGLGGRDVTIDNIKNIVRKKEKEWVL